MGFESVIASAVNIADGLTSSLQSYVTHEAWVSQDGYGQPVYASPVQRLAIVEHTGENRMATSGAEAKTSTKITILRPIANNGAAGRQEPVDPRDKFTCPNGITGPIQNITGLVNPSTSGPYLFQITLGGIALA